MRKYLFVILIVFAVSGCKDEKTESGNGGISLSKAMSDTETGDMGFEKAVEKRKFTFPDDHGPHPEFRTEWWYFTGNLTSSDNKQFGYQFTIFRTALNTDTNKGISEWSSNQIYMAHFAVTDISGGKFFLMNASAVTATNLQEHRHHLTKSGLRTGK